MCVLKILPNKRFLRIFINIIWLALLTDHVNGKPEDPILGMGKGVMMAIQQGAEILANGGVIRKDYGLEMPFGKMISKTEAGSGQAMLQGERRRKRDVDADILAEESLLPLPHSYFHHILKRSPCHTGTGGAGGGGTGGGTGIPSGGGDDLDIAERRRRAYARMRKAAADKMKKAKAKAKAKAKKAKKSKLVNDVEQALTRRKRQSEQDDLSGNTSNDFKKYLQEYGEKIRNIFSGVMSSMQQMAQNLRDKFSKTNNQQAAE